MQKIMQIGFEDLSSQTYVASVFEQLCVCTVHKAMTFYAEMHCIFHSSFHLINNMYQRAYSL